MPETEIPTVVMPSGVIAEALGACEAIFPIEELPDHVDSHNRRKRRARNA